MHYLRIAPAEGLFHELSFPERLDEYAEPGDKHILDGNTIFWSEIFKTKNINRVIERLKLQPTENLIPQYLSIIQDRQSFINKVNTSLKNVCDSGKRIDEFFSSLETLSILCKLYSDYVFFPNELLLQNGFSLKEYSFETIYKDCLDYIRNPYLNFVKKFIIPIIEKQKPDLLFLEGKISFYNMAISKLVKNVFPHIHICITRHSSEYYSLNKITKFLLKNDKLFGIIDSIILEYFEETEKQLIHTLANHGDLSKNVGNLICKDTNNTIITTPLCQSCNNDRMILWKRSYNQYDSLMISPTEVADVRLEPYVKCHWNKCSFCGINKKYSYINSAFDINNFKQKLQQLKQFETNGIKYLWFIDEAILPQKLEVIAKFILEEKVKVFWQARCRIDKKLLNIHLVQQLKESGLKELRMGLESASLNVLKDMNKFDDDFSLELVENIVRLYTNNGISIHFPMIIGFPTETKIDRQRTFEFLDYLKRKYDLFTFNINIYELDVSSEVFKKWEEFSISQISFPCKNEFFLGNWIEFLSPSEKTVLIREQDQFMREKLYPWMPCNSLLRPHIFYRLCETTRNTLVWKSMKISSRNYRYYGTMLLQKNKNVTISFDKKNNSYLFYNWNNHHYMHGNELLLTVLNKWENTMSIMQGVDDLISNSKGYFSENDLTILLKKLVAYEYLVEVVPKNDHNISVAEYYDKLYSSENYPYRVEPDIMLRVWSEFIPVGKVLDLGIGSGKDVDYLLSLGNEICGIDISQISINKLNQHYPNMHCNFMCADIRDFYICPETYSLIICSMVLSHLTEYEVKELSQNIQKGLVTGGCVYICDLSEYDPMIKNGNTNRCAIRTNNLLEWFNSLETVVITSSYQKEPRRIDFGGYFGLVKYIGKK